MQPWRRLVPAATSHKKEPQARDWDTKVGFQIPSMCCVAFSVPVPPERPHFLSCLPSSGPQHKCADSLQLSVLSHVLGRGAGQGRELVPSSFQG